MKLTTRTAELLLVSVIAARATSFMFSKLCLEELEPFNLMSIRFLMAFLLMAVLFHRRLQIITRTDLLSGIIIGTAFFAVLAAEFYGLKTTASSTASFLENTAIVFVPLFEAAIGRRLPEKGALVSALLAIIGVGLLTLKSGAFALTTGELLLLLAAVLYAAAIIITNRLSRKGDSLTIGIVQVGTTGLWGTAFAFIFENPTLSCSPMGWLMILGLAIVCTSFGFTLQPVAQSRTSAEKAGLFCALSPLIAAVMGMVFLHEKLGIQGIIGATFILLAILASYYLENKSPKDEII